MTKITKISKNVYARLKVQIHYWPTSHKRDYIALRWPIFQSSIKMTWVTNYQKPKENVRNKKIILCNIKVN